MTTSSPLASATGAWNAAVSRLAATRAWRLIEATGPMGLAVVASLGLHVLIGVVLVASAWSVRGPLAGGRARSEVVINIPPPPAAVPGQSGDGPPDPAPPAPVEAPPPVLQGLASRAAAAPLPALRSAGADVPAASDLLRRQDDAAVGATFAGLGARQASSVVYVVDASGAMVSSLKWVFKELERSVGALSSAQKFQVVLFRETPGGQAACEIFGGARAGLAAATPANKAALSQWLATIEPTGRSNPLDGLKRAIELDPDAVFLLSRSIRRSSGERETGGVWGRGPEETLAELDRLNPKRAGHRRVVIKAIQFLEEDPTGTMQLIGTEHGDGPGSYRVLSLQDLGAR
jgi:hypothetical protein